MIRCLFLLCRPRLSLMNGVAAAAGFLLYPGTPRLVPLLGIVAGVSLLAAGGSALNQVLESDLDRLMARTRLRPLPRGELSRIAAILVGGTAILSGLLLAGVVGGAPVLPGILALMWYLGVYTPLKRRTPFALLLGALCGAISPLIGWQAAGGAGADFRIMLLAGLLYLWQIPHFLLLQRRHAADYRNAGMPLLEETLSHQDYAMLWRLWMLALAATTLMFPAFGIIHRFPLLWCAGIAVPLVMMAFRYGCSANFTYLNLVPVAVTLLLVTQRVLPVF